MFGGYAGLAGKAGYAVLVWYAGLYPGGKAGFIPPIGRGGPGKHYSTDEHVYTHTCN